MTNILEHKKIVLGVCGSIAAYKVVELARNLTLAGAQVDVVMTEAAQEFVGKATFQALTGRPVLNDMWSLPEDGVVGHVSLGLHADLIIIAPASANTIARLAHGLADDLLNNTVLASNAPVLLAPAMNPRMYANPATQANLATLRERNFHIIEPDVGRMAENEIGQGRLPPVARIEGLARSILGKRNGPLRGKRVVVSAAGTHEPIDPVRYIGNRSSGRMGYAIAAEARDMGADVTLVTGPSSLTPPDAVEVIHVETALQMRDAIQQAVRSCDALIMSAAVADFRPAQAAEQKIKKGNDEGIELQLVRNPDILGELAAERSFVKVGFAAETEHLLENGSDKLKRKGLDLLVANDAVSSIGHSDSQVILLYADGRSQTLPRQAKEATASSILSAVVEILAARQIAS